MKYADIENLNPQELNKRIHQNKHLLFQTRMKHKMGRVSNFMEIADLRRMQARLQSVATTKKPPASSPSPPSLVKKASVQKPLPWKRKDFKKKKLKSEKKAKPLKPLSRVKKVTVKTKAELEKTPKTTEKKPPVSPQSSGFLSRWMKKLVKKDKNS